MNKSEHFRNAFEEDFIEAAVGVNEAEAAAFVFDELRIDSSVLSILNGDIQEKESLAEISDFEEQVLEGCACRRVGDILLGVSFFGKDVMRLDPVLADKQTLRCKDGVKVRRRVEREGRALPRGILG